MTRAQASSPAGNDSSSMDETSGVVGNRTPGVVRGETHSVVEIIARTWAEPRVRAKLESKGLRTGKTPSDVGSGALGVMREVGRIDNVRAPKLKVEGSSVGETPGVVDSRAVGARTPGVAGKGTLDVVGQIVNVIHIGVRMADLKVRDPILGKTPGNRAVDLVGLGVDGFNISTKVNEHV